MLTINVSLRSSHSKLDKTVDAKEHFDVSRCFLLAMKIHHIKSRYFDFSDRFTKYREHELKVVSAYSLKEVFFAFFALFAGYLLKGFFTHS